MADLRRKPAVLSSVSSTDATNVDESGAPQFDFGILERELTAAIARDQRLTLENEAKLRAVEQRVGSYQQFCDMVKAAGMKPLDRHDRLSLHSAQSPLSITNRVTMTTSRNHVNHSRPVAATGRCEREAVSPGIASDSTPATQAELVRAWRSCANAVSRLDLLRRTGAERFQRLIRADLPSEVLTQLLGDLMILLEPDQIHVWEQCGLQTTETVVFAVRLLQSMAESKSFSICLQFLSPAERNTAQSLLTTLQRCVQENPDSLASHGVSQDNLSDLLLKYKIPYVTEE